MKHEQLIPGHSNTCCIHNMPFCNCNPNNPEMSGGTGMKVHKVVLIIVDFDKLGADGVRDEINNMNYPNDCMSPVIMSIETKDIGEWAEDHPINKDIKSEASKLFPPTPPGLETVPEGTTEAIGKAFESLVRWIDDGSLYPSGKDSEAYAACQSILTRHRAPQCQHKWNSISAEFISYDICAECYGIGNKETGAIFCYVPEEKRLKPNNQATQDGK